MAYITDLLAQAFYSPPVGSDLGLPRGAAYSSYYPAWETQTPQYISPNPYSTIQSAFRQNEFVYSIIIKRAQAEAKGHFQVMKETGEHPEEIKDHALTKLIRNPNKNMTENDFWGIKRISQDLAGFAAFEIEYNMLGEPMRLWFMRPDWCSFRRAQQDPLAFIRYQPYGLAPMDIPLVDSKTGNQKILFFSNAEDFDPLYPGVRFASPAMHALSQIKVDNAMTFFLADFVEHGAKPGGVLSVAQTIDDNTAADYRRRWREQHGGAGQWSEPLVLGLGATYTSMQMNFKDMAFPDLDARTETRICNAFNIESIVADARAGLDVSSYNNKKQAVKDWYMGWVSDTWETNAEIMKNQMLPIYEEDTTDLFCNFDVSKVYAMQEDRSQRWSRAVQAWEKRLVTMNVALEEAGLEPVEGEEGDSYYEAVTLRPQETVDQLGEVTGQVNQNAPKTPEAQAAAETEKKAFAKFAKARIKEGKSFLLDEFEFKFLDADEQRKLIAEFKGESELLVLANAINKAVEALV